MNLISSFWIWQRSLLPFALRQGTRATSSPAKGIAPQAAPSASKWQLVHMYIMKAFVLGGKKDRESQLC